MASHIQAQCFTRLFPVSCQNAAKQAAAAATQTIAAAQHAASSNRNQAAQQQLVQSCKVNILTTCFSAHMAVIDRVALSSKYCLFFHVSVSLPLFKYYLQDRITIQRHEWHSDLHKIHEVKMSPFW